MCGIVGIYNLDKKKNIVDELLTMMSKLQHRGKDSFGISYKGKNQIIPFKKKGMITGNIITEIKEGKDIISCVGHLKYRTSNMSDIHEDNIQPIIDGNISVSHNGNIPNVKGFDTQHILNEILKYNGNFKDSLINLIKKIPAAYSLVIQNEDNLYLLKDRYGIRPLSYGFKGNNIYISSETIGLEGCNNITEVDSGQILEINNKSIHEIYKDNNAIDNICAFEFIYFMNPHSIYKNFIIQDVRKMLIKKLVETEKKSFSKDYIVVGVPNSGIIYGEEYSRLLSLNYKQLIMKTTDERSFISSNKEEIKKTCHKKFKYDKEKIKDNKIIVIDDTIVRGNVMRYICKSLKECGAKEIHVRIPSPPIIDICQLGIPINNKRELLMLNNTNKETCSLLGIDSLLFLEKDILNELPFDTYRECFGGGIKEEIIAYLKQI
tara:strand:+ start:1252 stop:2553 length:1302 start_codon:yes stop_codon:yes gene_type:complete